MSPTKAKNKPSDTARPVVEELTYEQALAELEQIVAALEANRLNEAGQLSLDEAMALFERGQALSKRCLDLLDKAELRVRQLSGENLVDLPTDI